MVSVTFLCHAQVLNSNQSCDSVLRTNSLNRFLLRSIQCAHCLAHHHLTHLMMSNHSTTSVPWFVAVVCYCLWSFQCWLWLLKLKLKTTVEYSSWCLKQHCSHGVSRIRHRCTVLRLEICHSLLVNRFQSSTRARYVPLALARGGMPYTPAFLEWILCLLRVIALPWTTWNCPILMSFVTLHRQM